MKAGMSLLLHQDCNRSRDESASSSPENQPSPVWMDTFVSLEMEPNKGHPRWQQLLCGRADLNKHVCSRCSEAAGLHTPPKPRNCSKMYRLVPASACLHTRPSGGVTETEQKLLLCSIRPLLDTYRLRRGSTDHRFSLTFN